MGQDRGWWSPLTNVHIFDYPFEGEEAPVAAALSPHGEVKEMRKQRYSFNPDLFSGTHIVRMVLQGTPPRMLLVGGYLCRLWYRGHPLICHICKEEGHRAAGEDNRYTGGVGFRLAKRAQEAIVECKLISPRIILARFWSKTRNVTFINCSAPTNEAEVETKVDFYDDWMA